MVYFLALEECETFFSAPTQQFKEGKEYYSTGVKRIPSETSHKNLLAYDLATGELGWKYPQSGRGHSSGGTMTTAGGLLFFADEPDRSKRSKHKQENRCGISILDKIRVLLQ